MGFHVNDLSDLPLHTARLRTPRVSVVLPLRNAEEEAEHRIAEIAVEAEYSHISICEIIAVDDDSEDLTWAVLQSLARREPLLRPIRLRRSFGAEAAREAGALAATGDIVITLEPDVPATHIVQLEGMIEAGHDIVTGYRPGRARGAAGRLLRLLSPRHQRQPLSGTAAYRREAICQLARAHTALAHMAFAAPAAGFRLGEMRLSVPPVARARDDLHGLAGVMGAALRLMAGERAMGMAMLAGLCLMLGAVVLPLPLFAAGLPVAFLGVGAAVLFLFGAQLAVLGLIGGTVLPRPSARARVAETLLRHGDPE